MFKVIKQVKIYLLIVLSFFSLSGCTKSSEEYYQMMIEAYQAKDFTISLFNEAELSEKTTEVNNKFSDSDESLKDINIVSAFIASRSQELSFVLLFDRSLNLVESRIINNLYSLSEEDNDYMAAGTDGRFYVACNSEEAYKIYRGYSGSHIISY